jgi:GNAT superfamily N-acetyltransferase
MPLVLSPATADDGEAIARIWADAFANDALDNEIYKSVPHAVRIAWATPFTAMGLSLPNVRLLKATDSETGEVVAFADWEIKPGTDEAQEGREEEFDAGGNDDVRRHQSGPRFPAGANESLSAAFQTAAEVLRRKHMRGREHYRIPPPFPLSPIYLSPTSPNTAPPTDLVLLATAPAHQHRGAATQLLRWGRAAADAARLPAYVEANGPASRALYARHGWAVVDEFVLDLGPYGAEPQRRPLTHWCMLKEPLVGGGGGEGEGP